MSDFIVWNDSYAFGIPEIDSQHGRIIKIINELYVARQSSHVAVGDFKRILLFVKMYTETHFHFEETLMKYAMFPDFEEHKGHHKEMVSKINGVIKALFSDSGDQAEALFQYLKDWWLGHIQGIDRKYVPHMKRLGL